MPVSNEACGSGRRAILPVAHEPTHGGPVLLLDLRVVVLVAGASARGGDVLLATVAKHLVIDELAPVVGIHPQHGKRELAAGEANGFKHVL